MRHGMMALLGVVMLSWSGTSLAASLADRALDFEGSFTSPDVASPGLRMPHASPLHLMPRGGKDGGGAVQMEDSTRAILAVVLSLIVGFGTGHFIIGDGSALLFLALDAGVIVAIVAISVAAYAMALSGGIPFFVFLTPILGLVAVAVRIWEVIDIVLKSGIAGGPKPQASEVIVPRTGELARSAFQPAMANGLNLRF